MTTSRSGRRHGAGGTVCRALGPRPRRRPRVRRGCRVSRVCRICRLRRHQRARGHLGSFVRRWRGRVLRRDGREDLVDLVHPIAPQDDLQRRRARAILAGRPGVTHRVEVPVHRQGVVAAQCRGETDGVEVRRLRVLGQSGRRCRPDRVRERIKAQLLPERGARHDPDGDDHEGRDDPDHRSSPTSGPA
jgi:hypothetical protein